MSNGRYACSIALVLAACRTAPLECPSACASPDIECATPTGTSDARVPEDAASLLLSAEAGTTLASSLAAEPRPMHPAGDRMAVVRAYYGVPMLQKSLAWDGNGEVDDFGFGIYNFWFIGNDFALGAGLNGSKFLLPGADAYAAELQGLMRIYVAEIDHVGLFVGGGGGWLQSTKPVPTGGTVWNMTFEFGPGLDVPLGGGKSLLVGADYHHLSNALGRDNPRNPSQNEVRGWIGFALDW